MPAGGRSPISLSPPPSPASLLPNTAGIGMPSSVSCRSSPSPSLSLGGIRWRGSALSRAWPSLLSSKLSGSLGSLMGTKWSLFRCPMRLSVRWSGANGFTSALHGMLVPCKHGTNMRNSSLLDADMPLASPSAPAARAVPVAAAISLSARSSSSLLLASSARAVLLVFFSISCSFFCTLSILRS